jgi:large subunit ribosomal protein L22
MEVQAIIKNVRMSPQKMREVVRQIQGLPALQAQAILKVVPRKGARVVAKTLASAMANAEQMRTEWTDAKLKQAISDLEGRIANTRNHKRQNQQQRQLAQYQGFLASPHRMAAEALVVKEAVAQKSSILRRFTPKARGSAGPILKRNCHVRIVLSDE